jgi:aminopeptidase-like protein
MDPGSLAHSLTTCLSVFYVLENDRRYCNLNPKCEPQLGRRGLYREMGGNRDVKLQETAMLWVLNQSDGQHSLLDIAERCGLPFETVHDAAGVLLHHGLLKEVPAQS